MYGAGLVNARAAVAGLSGGAPAAAEWRDGRGASRPFVHVKKTQRARTVRRRGIRVRVRSVRAGRVRVRVKAHGHLIARGSKRVRAERAATVVARLTKRGRRAVRRGPFTARVRVRLPGEKPRPRAQDPHPLRAAVRLRAVPEPLTHRPDVLVLAAGGTLGEAWMRGLLDGAGRATGIDFRDCEYFVGTSAGSIVAAFLAAGREPDSGPEARAAKEWGSKAGEANGAPEGIPLGVAPPRTAAVNGVRSSPRSAGSA